MDEELLVYSSDLEVLVRHRPLPRSAGDRLSELPEHRPQQGSKQREAQLRPLFVELGPAADPFPDGLLKTHRMGRDQAQRLLPLLDTDRQPRLASALERAASFGAFSLRWVERLLAAHAQPEAPPEPLGDQRHLREIRRGGLILTKTIPGICMLIKHRFVYSAEPES